MEKFFKHYWCQRFDKIASTQDKAKHYHRTAYDKKSVVFLTNRQTKGYGRRGHYFLDSSHDGLKKNSHNFFLSLYLPHFLALPHDWQTLGLLVGIGLFDSLAVFLPDKDLLNLKWPNDILLDDKKLAGILVEKIDDAVVIGVGVNLHHAPAGFGYLASATHRVPDNEYLARDFLTRLDRLLLVWQKKGFAVFLENYEKRSLPLGSPIEFSTPKTQEKMRGIYQGITPDGRLKVMVDGQSQHLSVADIS
ncbi:MAG: biotin--[acetyl-CoA-carboxylase] ligase [Alphaproteobacteria bacterium]